MERRHPPIADKVALVDFDDTLYPFGFLFDYPEPIPGAVNAVNRLKNAGYRIVIFTSRLSKVWLESVNQRAVQHIDYIYTICQRDGIPIDDVTAEKIPAEVYFDDKAYRFEGDWSSIIDKALSHLPVAQSDRARDF